MFHRDREEQKQGPIVRYRRGGKDRGGPIRRSKRGPSDETAGSPTASPTAGGQPSAMGSPTPPSIPSVKPPSPIGVTYRPWRASGPSGVRLAVTLFSVLVVVAAVAVPLISLGSTVQIPSFAPFTTPVTTAPGASGGKTQQPSTPTPSGQLSFLTASGLRAGLTNISRLAPGARLTLVRVDAGSMTANAVLPNGNAKLIVLRSTGTFVLSGAPTGERPIPITQIRPRAITRIVATMRIRFHVPASRIDYIVLSSPSGAPTQWITFTKALGHPGFAATFSGTRLTRLPG